MTCHLLRLDYETSRVILQVKEREHLFSAFSSDKEEEKGSCAICIPKLPEKRKPKKKTFKRKRMNQLLKNQQETLLA